MTAAPTFGGEQNAEDLPTPEAWNDVDVPTIIFLLVICVVGTIGNSLVIHVYRTQLKMPNSKKCFILCLSIADLFTCCFSIPLDISTILEQYKLEHLWLCKSSRLSNTVGTISSAFILLFIAVDRFRKVCKPFGWQIQTRVAKILCGLSLFLAVMVSWPAIFLYGKHTYDIPEYNMTGTECSTSDNVINTQFPFFHALALGFVIYSGIISIVILYCFIGYKIQKQTRKMKKILNKNMPVPSTSRVIVAGDPKLIGKVDHVMAKHEIANNRNRKRREKKNTKTKQESGDIWAFKKDYEPKCTFSQENREKDKSLTNLDNINNLDKGFLGKQHKDNSDSEDNGIKDEAITDGNKQKEIKIKVTEDDCLKKIEMWFQTAETRDIKTKVSKTASEQVLSKRKGIIRRMFSLGTQISYFVIQSVTRTHENSDSGKQQSMQPLAQTRARRTTFVFFFVTLTFIISSLPHLMLMLIRQVKDDFVEELSDTNMAVYKCLLRSFFLNNAINPIIYSICDSQFKSACKNIFGRFFRVVDRVK